MIWAWMVGLTVEMVVCFAVGYFAIGPWLGRRR